ncbi:MAG: PDZ domain-containing protein [Deltaproteobacteria bacterium]|jgi:predicted metalloprotease with PDZ domain
MLKKLLITTTIVLAPIAAFAGKGHECTAPVQDCLNEMVSKLKQTGFIGVDLDDAKGPDHLVVTEVFPGTAAENAGIKKGDILVGLDGITFAKEHWEKMSKIKVPGKKVTCTIKRDGKKIDLPLTLTPMPADLMAKYIGDHMMSHAKLPKDAQAKK